MHDRLQWAAAGMEAPMMDTQIEGMSTGGPADDGAFSGSMATPPLTDGHSMPPDTSRVQAFLSAVVYHDLASISSATGTTLSWP